MQPQANIVCFRFIPNAMADAGADAINGFTERLRQRHLESGPQYVVMTRFGGNVWLRCTLMNPLTQAEDLAAMLDRVEALAAEVIPQ